jgi:serine/threonine-protein kinase
VNALIGRVLDGRYRIEEQLGAGGVGAVYCGTQIALGRPVAIKILHEGVHPSFTQRFEREAKALAALRHPNIVAVTDYGVCDDTPFLVMELLEGETLAYRLMKGRIQPDQVLELARQLLRALTFVHEQGLVHRDLKPGNLFLERLPGGEERLKLLDFGLAKFVQSTPDPAEPAVTRAGDIVGTPAYISPEQVAGDTVDARVDTYAMGIMLFQMLSGRVPFEGEPVEQLKSHLVAPVPALHDKHPGLIARPELESFLQRAMAKPRDARFQNCADMLAALEAIPQPWLKKLDGKVEPAALASTMLSTPPPDGSLDAATNLHVGRPSETQLVRYARRYGTLGLAVISMAAMALVGALLMHDRRVAREAAAAAAAGEPESEPLGAQASAPPAADDGRHSSARVGTPTSAAPPLPEPLALAPDRAHAEGAPAAEAVPAAAPRAAPVPEAQPPAAPAAQPAAAPSAQPAQPQRAPARNPWARNVPKELKALRSAAVAGERSNDRAFALIRKFNRNNPTDARGHLLLAHFYMNRMWRNDALTQYQLAYELDPTVRGAPEVLRDLLTLVAHGSVAEDAARLVRTGFGREALPAIDRAIRALAEHDAALTRMTALRAAIAGP